MARINLWTSRLPGLAARRDDIESKLGYKLHQCARVHTGEDACRRFLDFATGPNALWQGDFRDLNTSVARIATLCVGGRITLDVVEQTITRLVSAWYPQFAVVSIDLAHEILDTEQSAELDLFTLVQLNTVLEIFLRSHSRADAGRKLIAVSRQSKEHVNDSDRLRKYVQRFKLWWNNAR